MPIITWLFNTVWEIFAKAKRKRSKKSEKKKLRNNKVSECSFWVWSSLLGDTGCASWKLNGNLGEINHLSETKVGGACPSGRAPSGGLGPFWAVSGLWPAWGLQPSLSLLPIFPWAGDLKLRQASQGPCWW